MTTHDRMAEHDEEFSAADATAVSEALAGGQATAGGQEETDGSQTEDSASVEDDVDALLAELTGREPRKGEPQSWEDPALAGAMAAGPPSWLGWRWREIPAQMQRDALVGLRRWVDWLVAEFSLPRQVVPACWFRHSNIIAELHAAMNMEYKVWEEGAPSANPMMMWLPHLQAAEGRLRIMVENIQCDQDQHVETPVRTLDYDDELWRATVYTQSVDREIERPEPGETPLFVRARVLDGDGKVADTSEVAMVGAVSAADQPDVSISGERVSGAAAMTLHACGTGMGREAHIEWERAESQTGPWENLDTTDADDDEDESDPAESA